MAAKSNSAGPRGEALHYLVLSGSTRQESVNRKLAALTAVTIEKMGGTVDLAALGEFDLPLYDQDRQDSDGFPIAAYALRRRLETADALVISSPEYNASMSGVIKNAIDWLSRFRPQPFVERQCLLLSASPSMVGGNRGLWALRVPLEHLGARVYPDMFSLAQAHQAFTPNGQLTDQRLAERLTSSLESFMSLVEAAKHYPCLKQAWIEFLGEPTDLPAAAGAE